MHNLSKKSLGEFERAVALSFLIIFSDMRGENAGFPKEHTLAFAVGNPFPVPPSACSPTACAIACPWVRPLRSAARCPQGLVVALLLPPEIPQDFRRRVSSRQKKIVFLTA